MDTPSYRQGFTRKELLVVLGILVLGYFICGGVWNRDPVFQKALSTSRTAREIHWFLELWAADHDEEFPTAQQFSNEAFRELIKAGLVDNEKRFAIPGDPWHQNSPSGKGPDNNIGTAPEYAQALTRGECAFAYVSGLNRKSDPKLPLLANAFTGSTGVYTDSKSHKGGVFQGERCVWITVGGSARVGDLNSDFRVVEKKGSKTVDVFSKEWGTNPDNIKNPEG